MRLKPGLREREQRFLRSERGKQSVGMKEGPSDGKREEEVQLVFKALKRSEAHS